MGVFVSFLLPSLLVNFYPNPVKSQIHDASGSNFPVKARVLLTLSTVTLFTPTYDLLPQGCKS